MRSKMTESRSIHCDLHFDRDFVRRAIKAPDLHPSGTQVP